MKKGIIATVLCVSLITSLSGCTIVDNLKSSNDPALKQWKLVEESAMGSKVTLYVPELSEIEAKWFNDTFIPYLKEQKSIELVVEELEFDRISSKLIDEKLSQKLIGEIDLLLLPENGFKYGYDKGLWYGPFVSDMPMLKPYIDSKDMMFKYEGGVASNGYTLPVSQEQLVMVYDRDVFFDAPTNWNGFFEALKEYKGTFTYPDPRLSRAGEAFILSYLLSDEHLEDFMLAPMDKVHLKEMLASKYAKLKDIKPYMYQKGEMLPKSVAELDQLFNEGHLLFSMSMGYNHATEKLSDYEYPEGAYSFVFDEGTLTYNENMVIAHNAPNKSGAMVVLQALLEPEMQASRYEPKKTASLPIYTPNIEDQEAMKKITSVRVKPTSVKAAELAEKRIAEIPEANRKLMIQLWEEVVFGSGNE